MARTRRRRSSRRARRRREQLARVHDRRLPAPHLRNGGKSPQLDPDTYTSPESHEIALLAAGAAIDAVERVMGAHRTTPRSRWCGRRGITPSAIARWGSACSTTSPWPRRMRARKGAAKVAIVDYDVHHGNGTQHIFEADPHVLYVSTHQYPVLPGHRRGRRDRPRGRTRLHGQRAARSRRGRRRLPARVRRSRAAGAAAVRAGSDHRVRRLRRARARSARRHAPVDGGVCGDDAGSARASPRSAAAAASSR